MGFTVIEKNELKKLIRSKEITTEHHAHELDTSILEFMKNENLLNQIHDYGIFPKNVFRRFKYAENIVISKFMDIKFDLILFLKELGSILSPPYIITIDCSMIISNLGAEDNFRFVWPQRNLAFNETKRIETDKNFIDLITELDCIKCPVETMMKVYHNHQNQACFDQSGYIPMTLLSTVFFISKI